MHHRRPRSSPRTVRYARSDAARFSRAGSTSRSGTSRARPAPTAGCGSRGGSPSPARSETLLPRSIRRSRGPWRGPCLALPGRQRSMCFSSRLVGCLVGLVLQVGRCSHVLLPPAGRSRGRRYFTVLLSLCSRNKSTMHCSALYY